MKDDLLKYLDLQKKLYHFEAIEKIGEIRAKILFRIFATLFLFTFLMFLGIGTALYLNHLFNSIYLGFTLVSLLFFIVLTMSYIFKTNIKNWMFKNYINNNIPS
ncbi:hypothetical protein FHR24_001602 [Wenyingzhuangia heitensis]|uniref:Holin-X, holin superfamily III n=1 Tax=Wenyingzhuangia heitensis TaxID=1487859 RepID=A0ABX0U8J7_9FLAO|nr:hypothetical protein [Wenyingzhuangia heitensis]NIJ45163.1 hypothetical protein [Wenyingzhuangia heitensis]